MVAGLQEEHTAITAGIMSFVCGIPEAVMQLLSAPERTLSDMLDVLVMLTKLPALDSHLDVTTIHQRADELLKQIAADVDSRLQAVLAQISAAASQPVDFESVLSQLDTVEAIMSASNEIKVYCVEMVNMQTATIRDAAMYIKDSLKVKIEAIRKDNGANPVQDVDVINLALRNAFQMRCCLLQKTRIFEERAFAEVLADLAYVTSVQSLVATSAVAPTSCTGSVLSKLLNTCVWFKHLPDLFFIITC